jgi:adenylate cyclase
MVGHRPGPVCHPSILSEDNVQNSQLHEKIRPPLAIRLSGILLLLFILGLALPVASLLLKQRHILSAATLDAVEAMAGYLATGAAVPLLAEDTLRLHAAARDAAAAEGAVYAFIVDRNRIIRAHSAGEGEAAVGREFTSFAGAVVVSDSKNGMVVRYVDAAGRQIFDVARSVIAQDKTLGVVHLGLEGDFIRHRVQAGQLSLLVWFFAACLPAAAAFVCLGALASRRIRARTAALVDAAVAYGNGNLRHPPVPIKNDELGDVGRALHDMAQKLEAICSNQMQLENYLKFPALNRILEGPQIKGEEYAVRRQVAVLFAGVKDFGAAAEAAHPEDIVVALNRYISIVTGIIGRHGGYVDKIIGDAVVGIFGVSLYHEEHTTRALRAAVELQQALAAAGDGEGKNELLDNVCIGVSAGIVLSGNIGSHSRVEYSSIGESIKEAYSLISLGRPGEIMLGEGVYLRMQELVQAEPLAPQQVIGAEEPLRTYRFLHLRERGNTG